MIGGALCHGSNSKDSRVLVPRSTPTIQQEDNKMKKVLIVEDSDYYRSIWADELEGKVTLKSVADIEGAELWFNHEPNFDAIVMDACVPGSTPNTLPLVRKFRASFAGPIIAVSSDYGYLQDLLKAGCDHESSKDALPKKLLEVLGM